MHFPTLYSIHSYNYYFLNCIDTNKQNSSYTWRLGAGSGWNTSLTVVAATAVAAAVVIAVVMFTKNFTEIETMSGINDRRRTGINTSTIHILVVVVVVVVIVDIAVAQLLLLGGITVGRRRRRRHHLGMDIIPIC